MDVYGFESFMENTGDKPFFIKIDWRDNFGTAHGWAKRLRGLAEKHKNLSVIIRAPQKIYEGREGQNVFNPPLDNFIWEKAE